LIANPDDEEHRHASSCGESLLGDFYDLPIRLSLLGYLRPELPFEGIDKLVAAIKQDIANAEQLGEASVGEGEKGNGGGSGEGQEDTTTTIQRERAWIASDDDPIPPSR
jgi:hypothetical protein